VTTIVCTQLADVKSKDRPLLTAQPRRASDGAVNVAERKSRYDIIAERGQLLWAELHSKADPDKAWFDDWCNRVPKFNCSCSKDLMDYLGKYPVDWDNFYRFSVELHRAVSCKLDKPGWSILTYDRDVFSGRQPDSEK